MNDTQLANRPQTRMEQVRGLILSPDVKERFTEMMGPDGLFYLNQVLMIVANSTDLQECSVQSILIAAGRAASLKLSLDPAQGQAWIIPYAKVATYQTGYKGVYELALRTQEYKYINVFDVFEGEYLEENRMTGIHSIAGKKISDKIVGYCLYFQLINGYEKTFYMTVAQIEEHANTYAHGNYTNPKSAWNKGNGRERPKMMKKTVLSNGLRQWGKFNPSDRNLLDQIENEQGFVDYGNRPGELETLPKIEEPKQISPEFPSEFPDADPNIDPIPPEDPPISDQTPSTQPELIPPAKDNKLETAKTIVYNGKKLGQLNASQLGDLHTELTDKHNAGYKINPVLFEAAGLLLDAAQKVAQA